MRKTICPPLIPVDFAPQGPQVRSIPLSRLLRLAVPILLVGACLTSHAQTGEWVWVSGSNIAGSSNAGVYGSLGMLAPGNTPGGREWATSWTDAAGNFWLFGGSGWDSKDPGGTLNDFWEFSSTTNQWVWRGGSNTAWWFNSNAVYGTLGTPAIGNIPGSRYSALDWTDSGGNLWLFGGEGYDAKGNLGGLNDLWEFNPTTNLWAWMGGNSTVGASGFHPGVYGTLGTAAPGNLPGSRSGAVGWTDANGNLWLFGGFGWDAGGHPGYLNDLWEFNPSTNQWAWMGGSSTVPNLCNSIGVSCGQSGTYGTLGIYGAPNVPGGRSDATGWADANGHLWLFGGTGFDSNGNPGTLNDLWEFNPSASEWMWMGGSNLVGGNGGRPGSYGSLGLPDGVNNPGARSGATSWIDGNHNFWLFGGYGYVANGCCGRLNDLWEFDPSTNQWAWMGGSSNAFNQPGTYGTLGAPNSANIPGGRTTASGWTDSRGNLWLFGGEAYDANGKWGELSDLWEYQLSTASLPQAAAPTFSVASGTYSTTQTVTISDATPGATIHYTTDGTAPTTASIEYSGAVTVSSTETLEAVATANSYSPSAIAARAYVISAPGQSPSPTTTVLTSSLNPSEFGQPVTFTARVSGQSGGIASGTVTFSNGGTTLASAPLSNGSAILTTSKLPQSTDLISAVYSGDFNFAGSVSTTLYQAVSDDPGVSGMWTWMGGSNVVESSGGQSGEYGIFGIPAANNIPGSRVGATSWMASNGHVWLFGGWGYDGADYYYFLNELWEFNPSTNQWTWRGGSSVIGGSGHNGVYGTLGSPAAGNIPGSRQNAAGWTDPKGNFWLFGGIACIMHERVSDELLRGKGGSLAG